jgi:hypothetical protein
VKTAVGSELSLVSGNYYENKVSVVMEMASFSLKIRHVFADTSLTERSIGAGPPVIIQLSGLYSVPTILSGWSSSLISKIWLIACRSGISKISILKDIYLENRFIYKLEAILFEEMRRIDLTTGNREIYGKFSLNI